MKENQLIESKISIREELNKYLFRWKYFVLSIFICLVIAFFYNRYTRSIYNANTTIRIQNDEDDNNSQLAAFNDLSIANGFQNSIENEIQILKSRELMKKVILKLGLNITYNLKGDSFEKELSKFFKNTTPLSRELYPNKPFNVTFLSKDSIINNANASVLIEIISDSEFNLKTANNERVSVNTFGEKITSSFGDFILVPNFDSKSDLIGKTIEIKLSNLDNLASFISKSIGISTLSEKVLLLSLNSTNSLKARDIINTLIEQYNDEAVAFKDEMSKKTSDFVNNRLEDIESELTNVDDIAENFRRKNRVTDITSEAGINLQRDQANEDMIIETNTQIALVDAVNEHINNTQNDKDFLPSNLGFENTSISETASKYNELIAQRKRMLKSSTDKNPMVVNLDGQIESLKNNLKQNLQSTKNSYKIRVDALEKQSSLINYKLYSSPKKERQIRDIQRQQQIKESLFLYLLQKREEIGLSLGVTEPNAKVIDIALNLPYPIAPNKRIVYIMALFIAVLIPALIIYLTDLLNNNIHSRDDLERILKIPIIADIPKADTKKQLSISKTDHSGVAEAFRILRTNLNFINADKEKCHKIFVTSTIAHEGKSFVAANLAASLTFTNKRVVLIGMDIRAPKLSSYVKIRGKKGVTNYIIDHNLTSKDLIIKSPLYADLDIISSGEIPPNPSELLMSQRIGELFEELEENYDYIIVDTAASSMVTDTTIISKYADSFIFVVRANYLDKRLLTFAKSMHEDDRYPNMSLLLNCVDYKKGYGYGYGYGYGEKFKKSKVWWKRILPS